MFMRDNASRTQLPKNHMIWLVSPTLVTKYHLPVITKKDGSMRDFEPEIPEVQPITEAAKELAKLKKQKDRLRKREQLKPKLHERYLELTEIVKEETRVWKRDQREKRWAAQKKETASRNAKKTELERAERARSVPRVVLCLVLVHSDAFVVLGKRNGQDCAKIWPLMTFKSCLCLSRSRSTDHLSSLKVLRD